MWGELEEPHRQPGPSSLPRGHPGCQRSRGICLPSEEGEREDGRWTEEGFGHQCLDIRWESPPHPDISFSSHARQDLDGAPNIQRGLSRPLVPCPVSKDSK